MVYKRTLLLMALLFVIFVDIVPGQGNSTWVPFSDGYAESSLSRIKLSQSHEQGLVIDIEIPGVKLSEKIANGEKFVSVNAPSFDSTGPALVVVSTSETGKPKLPLLRAFIAIPKRAEKIQPEIIASSSQVLEDINIYPTGKPVEGNGRVYEEFAIDDISYSSDVLYPPLLAGTLGSFYLRDTRLTCLEIFPFQYNPAQRRLICYWKLRLRIRLGKVRLGGGVLSEVCGKTLLNYPQTVQSAPSMSAAIKKGNVYYPSNLAGICQADYLIIAPDIFYKSQKVSDLASWRAEYNGFDIAVVNTADIHQQFGGGKAGIRDFIKHAYYSWTAPNGFDGHINYVLLLGDVEYIPAHLSGIGTFTDKNIATDNWYACVSGEDCIPDVMLGRLSVKNKDELGVVVDKIIQYEKNPYRGEWIKRALLLLGTIDSELGDLEYTKDEILIPSGYTVTELAKLAGDNAEDVINEINRGHIIVDYAGHGFKNGWEIFTTRSIPFLRNRRMLPVIFSMSCSTAAFDDEEEDCFAEAMMKAPNGGCVAFFGASRLVPISDVAFSLSRGMVQHHLFVLGEIIMRLKVLGTLSEENIESYNLFGDPALSLYAPRDDYYDSPDLTISPADITFAPEEVSPGATIKINAVVHNIGESDVENVTVEFFREGDSQHFIGQRRIGYIPQKGTGEVSVSWRAPRGKAQNKILVKVNPVGGEKHTYDNHAIKALRVSIEAKNFPIEIDASISQDTSSASAPVLFDLDGDGNTELLVQGELSGSSYCYICAWRYDGTLMENFPVCILAANRYRKETVELVPAVGDVNGDGFAEIACTFRTKKVYLLRHDGRIAEGFPVQLRAFAASSPVLYDVNGDGMLEIVCALTNGEVDVLKNDGTPLDGFPVFIYSHSESAFAPPTVAIGDVDGDRKPEIVVKLLRLDDNLGEYVVLNHDGSFVDGSPIETPFGNLFPPTLGDIDNDCRAEIVCVSDEKNIYVLNPNGTLTAGFPISAIPPSPPFVKGGQGGITSSPVLGDVDSDGLLEIVATSYDYVYAWHHDGVLLNGFPIYVRGGNSHPILADIDGDGRTEIIFVNNGVYAYHNDGSPADGFPIKFDSSRVSAPALFDVDADGYFEIAVTTSADKIHLMEDIGVYSPKAIEWGSALHDTMNTNSYSARIDLPMPQIYLKSMQRDGNIVLSWRQESDLTDVAFYKILRAVFPTGPFYTLATVGKDASEYVDKYANSDVIYWYRIEAEDGTERPMVSNIVRDRLLSSSGPLLRNVGNYPNPAPSAKHPDGTIFNFYAAEDAKVRIRIYNIAGQLVDEINYDARGGINNEVQWKLSAIASGLYIYVVEATKSSGEKVTKKGRLAVRK